MAICSRHRTVVCLDFESTALLRYGQYPYGTVFCTAVAVYGTVESPNIAPLVKSRTKDRKRGISSNGEDERCIQFYCYSMKQL